MISSSPLTFIPDIKFTEYSQYEYDIAGPEVRKAMIDNSLEARIVYKDGDPVMLTGLVGKGLMSVPYLWTLMTPTIKSLGLSDLRNLVRQLALRKTAMETMVMEGFPEAARLAALFGFQPTDYEYTHEDKHFRLWRNTWHF